MIDALMIVWNRYHRKHGVKLLLTLLLIGVSISLLLFTIDMVPHKSAPNAIRHASLSGRSIVTVTTLVGNDGTSTVPATPEHKGGYSARPCVVKWTATPVRPTGVVTGRNRQKAKRTAAVSTPQPTPTLSILPTMTDEPVEPTETDEDTPTPEPTEEDTTVAEPTGVSLLPPEKTVIVLITPTAAMSTPTLTVSPPESDISPTATPPGDEDEVMHKTHIWQDNGRAGTSYRTANEQRSVPERRTADCFSNSVNMAGSENMGGLAFDIAVVLGSVLPVALLLYGMLCVLYMHRQERQ
jgi:hypothetical protein